MDYRFPTWFVLTIVVTGAVAWMLIARDRRSNRNHGAIRAIARFGLGVIAIGVLLALFVSALYRDFGPRVVVGVDRHAVSPSDIEAVLAPRIRLDADDQIVTHGSRDGKVMRVRVTRGAKPGGVAVPKTPAPPAVVETIVAESTAETAADIKTEIVTETITASGAPPEPHASDAAPPVADVESPSKVNTSDARTADAAPANTNDDAGEVPAAEPAPSEGAAAKTGAVAPSDSDASDAGEPSTSAAVGTSESPRSTASDAPLGAPAWVRQPSGWKDGVYRVVLESDPFLTERECQKQLDDLIAVEVAEFANDRGGNRSYFDSWIEPAGRDRVYFARRRLHDLDLTIGRVRSQAIKDSFVENYYSENAGRTMQRVYLLLEFDEAMQKDIDQRWKEYEARQKVRDAEETLFVICVSAGVILLGLGLLYGLLRFDTATKGYYTKRLIIGAVLLTMICVALASTLS